MLLLKRAKNGLSHFLLQAHTSSMWAFKSTLWYLFKIGFLLLNFVMESIRDNIFQLNTLDLGFLYFSSCSTLSAAFLPYMPISMAATFKDGFPQNSNSEVKCSRSPCLLTKVFFFILLFSNNYLPIMADIVTY